jgi:hypothetical protein
MGPFVLKIGPKPRRAPRAEDLHPVGAGERFPWPGLGAPWRSASRSRPLHVPLHSLPAQLLVLEGGFQHQACGAAARMHANKKARSICVRPGASAVEFLPPPAP